MADQKTNDFFRVPSQQADEPEDDGNQENQESQEAPEKLKVGEREYTQEELNDLVGFGEKLKEFETKQGQPFEDVIKSWGDRGNRIHELETKLTDFEKQQVTNQAQSQDPDNLTQEQKDQLITDELKRLGVPVGQEQLMTQVQDLVDAQILKYEVQDYIKDSVGEGKPEVSEQELLLEMQRRNELDYDKVYRDMFKSRLDVWEKEQLEKQQPEGMTTESASTAGSKGIPMPTPITRTNLDDMVDKALSGEI